MPKRLRDDTAKAGIGGGWAGWSVNEEEGDHVDALFFVDASSLVRDESED